MSAPPREERWGVPRSRLRQRLRRGGREPCRGPRSRLVAIRPWPLPAGDRRDARLHRLFVIAYARDGDRNVDHRLGMCITPFRDGLRGGWRLLEATVEPPDPLRPSPTHGRRLPAVRA